jgi:hypothetical protein
MVLQGVTGRLTEMVLQGVTVRLTEIGMGINVEKI